MAACRIAYAALLVAALAFSQTYAGHLSSVFLITVLVLPLVSLIMAVIVRFALKPEFDCSPVIVERGTEVKLQLFVKNRFVFPSSAMFITASMPDVEDQRDAKLIFSLGLLQKKQLNFIYPSNFRGEYRITIEKAYIYDILKLFKLRKTFDMKKYVLVVPKLYNTTGSNEYSLSTNDETEMQTSDFSGGERSFERKYNDGDDIRKIHWKLSSKQEDYMVWQEVKNRFRDAIVFCDVAEYSDDPVKNAQNIDTVLEIGLAACMHNVQQGRDCVFAYYNKEYSRLHCLPVTSRGEFFIAVKTAAGIKGYKGEPKFSEEAKKLFANNENMPQTVLVTSDNSDRLIQLSKDISAISDFSMILAGKTSKEIEESIQALKRVRFAALERDRLDSDISEVLSKIY